VLAIGADFGGSLTLLGASANVMVAGMSEQARRSPSSSSWLTGSPATLLTLMVATPYLLLRYYL